MTGRRPAAPLILVLVVLLGDEGSPLDTMPRQVLIESRIVIANNDFARELGIQWGRQRMDEEALGQAWSWST